MLYKLTTPLSVKDIIRLKCGDEVLLSGTIITARDKAHAYLVQCVLNNKALPQRTLRMENLRRDRATSPVANTVSSQVLPFDLEGGVLYHCGPIISMKRMPRNSSNEIASLPAQGPPPAAAMNSLRESSFLDALRFASCVAAGPTTSSRMEPYMAEIIRKYGVRMIIGKGGMDDGTRKALRKRAVYCSAVGGAAQVLAQAVQRIENVFGLKEFGETEAFWVMRVEDFPIMVTMDAHGESLHEHVKKASLQKLKQLIG